MPPLGYLAPVCAGLLVISVWNSRLLDLESIPFRRGASVLSSNDVDNQFPQMKYRDWWACRRKESIAKETIASLGSASEDSRNGLDEKEIESAAPEGLIHRTDSAAPDMRTSKAQEHLCDSEHACEDDTDDEASNTSESGGLCAICMDSFEGDTDIRPLTCGHIFHPSCVDPWLTRRRASCPLCNKSFGDPDGPSEREETDAQPPLVLAVPRAALIRSDIFSREV
ncbi:hypothetical protein BDV26DRAFT_110277 [Aspergillus bertholletiae]|uniref:RING-type E3 ubiquitin transferase n=1 Tax=Aspergillus bertholletiae TaxID=1226010 RepID=A0A5N7BGP3_9EURO|nr:hypothetical protein BDV26DRAFT_110277 [Aspergillus bertholletiae]